MRFTYAPSSVEQPATHSAVTVRKRRNKQTKQRPRLVEQAPGPWASVPAVSASHSSRCSIACSTMGMWSVHLYQGAVSSGVRDRATLEYTSDVARRRVTDSATLECIEDGGLGVTDCAALEYTDDA